MSDTGIDAVVGALHVDPQNPIQVAFACIFDVSYMRNTRIVDENMNSLFDRNSFKHSHDFRLHRNIADVERHLPAFLSRAMGSGLRSIVIQIYDVDMSSLLGEQLHDRPADPARASSDYRSFAV